jgi:hypothetical protein
MFVVNSNDFNRDVCNISCLCSVLIILIHYLVSVLVLVLLLFSSSYFVSVL